MNTIRMTPWRSVQMAGVGYAGMYLASIWHPRGLITTLLAVLLYSALALALVRAAYPEPMRQDRNPLTDHPVQAGKKRLLRRNLPLGRTSRVNG